MLFFCERRTFIQFKLYKLQFWPLNDQITVSFVRAAGVLAKGRMFDIPVLNDLILWKPKFDMFVQSVYQIFARWFSASVNG